MTKMKNIPADDLYFLLMAADSDGLDKEEYERLTAIRSAVADLPDGVTVTAPEGRAWLLSARDSDQREKPIRIFYTEWEIDLIISISKDADEYGVGPKMIKTELPTGLRIDTI